MRFMTQQVASTAVASELLPCAAMSAARQAGSPLAMAAAVWTGLSMVAHVRQRSQAFLHHGRRCHVARQDVHHGV